MRSLLLVLALIATPWHVLAGADPTSSGSSSARIEWIEYTAREISTVFCVESINPYQPWGLAIFMYGVVPGKSGLELQPVQELGVLATGDGQRWTEVGLEGGVTGIEVDQEIAFGPGTILVSVCAYLTAWTEEVGAQSDVIVYATFNAIETTFERTLTPASRIDTRWGVNTNEVHALSIHEFEVSPARTYIRNEAADDIGHEVVVGGRQEVEVSEGFYGRFSHSDPEGGGLYGITRPDGGEVAVCPVHTHLCRSLDSSPFGADLLVGGPGRYTFWNEVTKTGHLGFNFFAFWVDAPLPPGVTVPP